MSYQNSTTYDFLSLDNEPKWKALLCPALRKIQKQVHPRLEIDDDALEYLEVLIFHLMSQMCSAHPHSITDVESHVQSTFAHPIDVWSLSEAQEKMERYAVRKRGVFLFPIEKLYHLLVKEVFGYKVDITVVQFIMAILDYVAADILKLAGNFVKNTRKNSCIIVLKDVHVSMSADPALQALFKPLQSSIIENIPGLSISDIEMVTDRSSMKYDELLRDLRENESQFIRQLNLILKVFQPAFVDNSSLFSSNEVEIIFEPVADVYDLSMQLLTSIEEMIEMASEMEEGTRYPQIGFCFEEVAESDDFSVYLYYTENYQQAVVTLENIIQDPEVCGYFKKLSDCGQLPKLFKEAVQYVLPKALMEPIYHFFYYCNIMQHMSKATEDEDDHIAFESAISGTLAHKLQVERESQRFLPRRREDVGVFGRRVGYRYSMKKLIDLQARIEGWDGPDIHMCCTELVKEGPVSIAREGGRKAMKQKMERHVILLDGLVLCCKIKKAATPVAPAEYRLKEKIVIKGHVNLIDIEETDDLKFAFELREEDSGSPGIIFILQSPPEKNEWMSAITILLIRSTFDKALEKKLKQEEKLIPVLLPDPEKYKFAEPNSEDNILFEEEQGDGQVLIKAGTIYKLVERLTFNEYADPTFVRTFLMTYRSFCKPVELIDLLIERYYIPPPSYSDDYESRKDPHKREALKRFKVDYVSPVQLRVLNVLRHWVENHYYDFQQEPEVLDKLKEFVGTVKAKNMQKLVASIHRTLNKKEGRDTGGPPSTSDPVFFDPPPQTEWHLTRNKDEFHILTLHPLEFARQLTLVMSDLFKAIRSSELVDASWTKEHKKENSSPNLLRMSRYETKLTNWIRHTIVFTENFEERVALCSRLVDIMEELIGLNNFAALFAFNAAFQSSQVFRLKSTMKELTPKRKQILEEISHVASTDKGYKHYRERLRSINPPCVLFVGMYLTWIVFIKDGNEGKVRGKPENFINFKKRRMIANILQEIQQYQNTPYCLKAEGSIQEYLQSHDVRGEMGDNQFEDYLYDQSVEIEPRDQPYKKAPRKHRFELRPPNTQPGALAHFLEVATIRRGPSDRKKQMSADEVSISSASGIEGSQSSHSLAESDSNLEKESDGKEKRKEEKEIDGPPPIPPKATHITTVGGVEVTSVATPPKLPPRSASPRLETLPDTFVTLSRPPKPHPPKAHRAPPEIPTETREEPPPRPPRIRDASPVTPSTPDNDAGMIPPPIPPHPRRSYSPSSSLNNYSPHSSPLPHPHSLPPPRPPPPRVGLSTDGMLGNNKETTPPAIPPRPLSHVAPPLPLSNNQAPPIPPKPIR